MGTLNAKVENPHGKLADLMTRELGVHVNATALRKFVGDYWERVSLFSHAIHAEVEAEKLPPRTAEEALAAIMAIVNAAAPGSIVDRETIRLINDSTKKPLGSSYSGASC